MGHESRIEPWVAVENRSARGVSDRISFVAKGNENPSEGKPKSGSPSIHGSDADRPEHLQCNYVGLEAKETAPGKVGEVFSLDFPVYRTALIVAALLAPGPNLRIARVTPTVPLPVPVLSVIP